MTNNSDADSQALPTLRFPIRAVCFDWGGTLMSEAGPDDVPMALWPHVAVIPGAKECLATLDGSLPLCIATNAADSGRPMIERALDRVGLLHHFSHVFCFTDLGFKKIQPEFWHAVQERLGLPPHEIAMVGDSLEYDVLVPQRCGLQSVWFNARGEHDAPPIPVPTVTSLEQFAGLVKSAVAKSTTGRG